ncbi:hypothetical protein [Blastopirellula marina]|uniref:Lipoprotein n=1 Tax=Blastopirellula marina DSM 3645 TaxID=314230 RepID=A4A322_9BACT|nr:hypothetical protein [Blastopirellula marina]EAQ76835.1 hypothetical protein DSM3645_11681 [Blastopirellula marina DSM 3645]
MDRTITLLLLALSLVFAGCEKGENLVKVSGQIVENGQAVSVPHYEEGVSGLRVIFVPLDETSKPVPNRMSDSAFAQQDGKFLMYGNMGTGIAPGKYRVAVQMVAPGADGADQWKGRYGPNSSPFEFDIAGSRQEVSIDLAKKPGS